MLRHKHKTFYIDSNEFNALQNLTKAISTFLNTYTLTNYSDIIILCIGTDRSTGDSLGPLVGYKLANLNYDHVHVFGSLEEPVHANNLEDKIKFIYSNYKNPLFIAIDACLGKMNHIGYISVSNNPISPGAGVNKTLPKIGHISIMGIVNFQGFMDFLVLQNTRLHVVMKMADLIALSLKYIIWKDLEGKIDIQNNKYNQIDNHI
jgi:putative sporulation protein YyaC